MEGCGVHETNDGVHQVSDEMLRELHDLCKKIFDCMPYTHEEKVKQIIRQVIVMLHEQNIVHNVNVVVSSVYSAVLAVSKIVYEFRDARKFETQTKQGIVTMSLHDLFVNIGKGHYHYGIEKGDAVHNCSYHRESLLCHLVMAAAITADNVDSSVDVKLRNLFTFAALVHDIGKPGVMNLFVSKKYGAIMSYPNHGPVGSHILRCCNMNTVLIAGFSINEWNAICDSTAQHMCSGYHNAPDKEMSMNRLCAMHAFNGLTRQILIHLAFGDSLGKFHDHTVKENPDELMDDLEKYRTTMSVAPTISELAKYVQQCSNILVLMRGMSASGKTTNAKRFASMLSEQGFPSVVIDRDVVMCSKMAEVYSCDVDNYQQCYGHYDQDKKKNSKIVNDEITRLMRIAFDENKIVFFASLLCTSNSLNDIVPNKNNVFVVAVDNLRTHEIGETDASRLGCTMDTQLNIAGTNYDHIYTPQQIGYGHSYQQTDCRLAVGGTDERSVTMPHIYAGSVCYTGASVSGVDSVYNVLVRICGAMNYKQRVAIDEVFTDNNIDVQEWFNAIAEKCNGDVIMMTEYFKGMFLEFKLIHNVVGNLSVYVLSYVDGAYTNESWDQHRTCRGLMFLKNGDKWILIRRTMDRAPEVASFSAVKGDLQDGPKINDMFDTLSSIMCGDGNINCIVVGKKDGSLIVVGIYKNETAKMIRKIVEASNSSMAKLLISKCPDDMAIVVGTSGRLVIEDASQMLPYCITALASKYCNVESLVFESMFTPIEVFEKIIGKFVDDVQTTASEVIRMSGESQMDVMTLAFEAICSNRTDPWTRKPHTELAVSSEKSGFFFLGSRNGNSKFESFVSVKTPFETPCHKFTTTSEQVRDMLCDTDNVVKGIMSLEEFEKKYGWNDICPEGFVVYINDEHFPKGLMVKIKSMLYYLMHKIRDDNMEKITSLVRNHPTIVYHYPISRIIAEFKVDVDGKLNNLASMIHNIIFGRSWIDYLSEKVKGSIYKGTPPNGDRALFIMNGLTEEAKSLMRKEMVAWAITIFPIFENVEYEDLEKLINAFASMLKMERHRSVVINTQQPHIVKIMNSFYELALTGNEKQSLTRSLYVQASQSEVQKPAQAE